MTAQRALVTQHLENVSREALEQYQDIIRAHIRNRQGIYALYRRGKLYYVGLASDLRSRPKAHVRDKHGESWDRFSVYLTIGDEHMRELEALILRIVKPLGNKVKGQFAKSESLLPRVRRDLRRRREEEETRLLGSRPWKGRRERGTDGSQMTTSKPTGRRPVLAAFIQRPTKLVARYKRKTYRARVRRDGSISLAGRVYNSPSLAGSAVVKRSCNGWTFWSYERSPGDWVPLEELRRR
jgi:hypothetical protein